MNLGGATLIQPRKFAQDFIKSLKERAEVVPHAGRRVSSGQVLKLGSDCTGSLKEIRPSSDGSTADASIQTFESDVTDGGVLLS